jgi:hypothetical protein
MVKLLLTLKESLKLANDEFLVYLKSLDPDVAYELWKEHSVKVHLEHIEDFNIEWVAEYNCSERRYEKELVTYKDLEKWAKFRNIKNYKQDLIKHNIGSYIIIW